MGFAVRSQPAQPSGLVGGCRVFFFLFSFGLFGPQQENRTAALHAPWRAAQLAWSMPARSSPFSTALQQSCNSSTSPKQPKKKQHLSRRQAGHVALELKTISFFHYLSMHIYLYLERPWRVCICRKCEYRTLTICRYTYSVYTRIIHIFIHSVQSIYKHYISWYVYTVCYNIWCAFKDAAVCTHGYLHAMFGRDLENKSSESSIIFFHFFSFLLYFPLIYSFPFFRIFFS